MPYICVNLTGTLTDQQKDELKRGLGEKIALIPGKSEKMPIEKTPNHLPNETANDLVFLFYRIVQSIGAMPCAIRNSLHCEKCLHPKKPLYADSGDGCTVSNTR